MKKENKLFPVMRSQRLKSAASFMWAFMATLLITSSVVQASDMQIYAVPTAGKKTIVMMLDTSGSMDYTSATVDYNDCNYGYYSETQPYSSNTVNYCTSGPNGTGNKRYGRIYRLQEGMFAFLNSNNSTLANVRVGLGQYSVSGSGNAGKILVPAAELGADINSSQRNALRAAVKDLTAVGGTPTAAAFAEAAAYLMGTNTNAPSSIQKDLYKKVTTQVFDRYECQNNSRPYLNSLNNVCYQYNNGFSGNFQTASTIYTCPPAGLAAYRNLGTSSSTNRTRCYINGQVNDNNPSSNYRAADSSLNCSSSSYPYLDSSSERCYQYQGFSGGSQNATPIYQPVDTYYKCISWSSTDFTNGVQYCGAGSTSQRTSTSSTYWQDLGSTQPTDFAGDGNQTISSVLYTYINDMQIGSNAYSGFTNSVDSAKKANRLSYNSPLPLASDRVSCDGQGVYILSDGEPSDKNDSTLNSIMSASLDSTSFSCSASGALTSTRDWHCMSNFAKKLFNGGVIQSNTANATNPVNVPIQTAFVGFGKDFNNIGNSDDVKNACKLSSRTQSDRSGDDACSPNQPTNAITYPGYGNGGFFAANLPSDVTASVIAFINNIGGVPLNPLTTGAISVPIDPLTSNGFQPFGYLRALEPNPANAKLVWLGNLKKYKVLLEGANAGAFAGKNDNLIYNSKGGFVSATKDLWNSSTYNDGGIIKLGGAYSKVPMPALGQTEDLTVNPPKYAVASTPNAIRTLFTDVASTGGAALSAMPNNNSLLRIPEGPLPTSNVSSYVLGKLNASTGQTTLKDFPLLAKQKILNYLGYSVPLDSTATALPSSLITPDAPSFAMGGSVHSFPVQLTYSGSLDANGDLTATRDQSVLYGSMEGGLHIVNGDTGVEQMVFVPSEILRNEVASKALVKGEEDLLSPTAGVDGAWVADPAYKVSSTGSSITARQMNVYGGLRMGGNSYYGLDVLDPSSPKLLFRAGADQSDFSRMGQSWSKPVLANIRYNGAIKRVMIVGGGYDTCYESPTATLTTGSCGTEAKGNAVYIIDAKTGARLWWASSSGSNTNNANMKHSIVSRISVLDRNADGLIDHLYFGDLGGQVFRADLNNNQTKTGSSYSSFGVRVVRLANLSTTEAGVALTDGKTPRFYEAPTVTIHDQGGATFIVVGIASGNRSTPLDVFPIQGRNGMSPAVALTDRLVNNVYGIIDRDFINSNLMTVADSTLITKDKNLSTFQKDPQKLASGSVISVFIPASGAGKDGWYRSLSSKSDGTERADNSFRIKGGLKAFEEPIALTGNLIVPVYDPQGTGVAPSDSCQPRVVGETDRQLYCLPFGVCLNSNGTTNTVDELKTGFLTTTDTAKCPAGVAECNDNTLGAGILGVSLTPLTPDPDPDSCGKLTLAGNITGAGEWKCTRKLNPTRWYEKYTSS